MRRHFSSSSPLTSHTYVESFRKPCARSAFPCAPKHMCTESFQGLLIGVHVKNFCVCCSMISEVSRLVETCRAIATVQLAISVPKASVLWNSGVYSLPEVFVLWKSGVYFLPEVFVLWKFGVYFLPEVSVLWNFGV